MGSCHLHLSEPVPLYTSGKTEKIAEEKGELAPMGIAPRRLYTMVANDSSVV